MKKRDRTGKEILQGLCGSGLRLVFVDESETSGKPLPGLAADYLVMCGVSMTAENYKVAKTRLQSALNDLGVDEFHATDMVHPRSASQWRRIRPKKRKHALALLANVLGESAESVFFCYVSGEQYYERLQAQVLATKGPDLNHKGALFTVFFNSLIPRLQQDGVQSAIIIDSKMPVGDEAIGLQGIRDPRGFYEGSLIHVDSRAEIGIQLADFAVYALNRIHHINQRQIDGKSTGFDELVMNAAKRMEPKLVDLLGG